MKIRKIATVLLLVLSLCLGISSAADVQAAGGSRKAGKAFATAISKGKIAFGKYATYSIGDMDGDGIKDLLIVNNSTAKVFAYKSGKIKTILKYTPEYSLGYDTGKKVFWESGEGDGSWHIAHKLKSGSLEEQYRYYTEYSENNEIKFYYQAAGEDASEITEEEYREIGSRTVSAEKTISKAKLIKKLKKLS